MGLAISSLLYEKTYIYIYIYIYIQVHLPQETADAFGAYCLTSLPPVYSIRQNASNTKWVLFLEGGGWCNDATANGTINDCARRGGWVPPITSEFNANANLVKSYFDITPPPLNMPPDFGGVMGANSTINPDFYEWNAVFFRYCDGGSFGTSRKYIFK